MATKKSKAKAPEKAVVVDALRASLARDLEAVDSAAHAARDASTHPENRPENDKDTRAIEAGYLAGAQAARAQEIKRQLHDVEKADLRSFALLSITELVRDEEVALLLLLSPWGGGQKVNVDGVNVQIVTPQSPLGAALKGKAAGDDVDVPVAGRVRSLSIVSVS
ncbi:MAG: transcription elongation factor GreAB [Deltaproteobacteria bacterium]|nr:transcription elongation factor GreAB [Deltaproteobacteria bacterium]